MNGLAAIGFLDRRIETIELRIGFEPAESETILSNEMQIAGHTLERYRHGYFVAAIENLTCQTLIRWLTTEHRAPLIAETILRLVS